MANRYFNNTIDLVSNTRARASDVESNFSAVEAGFDSAQVDIDAKAGLNSPAFTGTPTAPTAGAGTATTQLATAAFVQQEISRAATVSLPTVAGNAGRFLRSDGSLANWSSITGPVNVISGNTNAVQGQTYVFTAVLTLTLPTNPAAGDWVAFADRSGGTTSIIARNGQNIMGAAENFDVDIANFTARFVFADATRGWVIV